MSDDDIIRAVNLYKADWVILTGGEPALFIDNDFVVTLRKATGKKVAIESNGTLPLPPALDWVCVSPKEGICGETDAPVRAQRADEIKVVDLGQDLEKYFSLPCVDSKTLMYLQPCYVPDKKKCAENRIKTVARVLADPRWTLSVQLHRFLGIP